MNYVIAPEVLMHPNIPKPLHGVNPRTIMGQAAWDVLRREVYAENNYHCVACGVAKTKAQKHKWLEAHEYYDIDYRTGRVTIKKIIALCHFCHNFIHSGRLTMICGKEKSEKECIAILEHGFRVLKENDLLCFPVTMELAEALGAETYGVQAYEPPESDVHWSEWRLIYEGNEYAPLFADYEEWENHYANQ